MRGQAKHTHPGGRASGVTVHAPADHEPHPAAELVDGVDYLAIEGLVDDELSAEEGIPNAPHARIVIMIASMAFFLTTLGISIVNVALARVGADLGGGITGQQGIIDGYTLPFAGLLPFAGNLADRILRARRLSSPLLPKPPQDHHRARIRRPRALRGWPGRNPRRTPGGFWQQIPGR